MPLLRLSLTVAYCLLLTVLLTCLVSVLILSKDSIACAGGCYVGYPIFESLLGSGYCPSFEVMTPAP